MAVVKPVCGLTDLYGTVFLDINIGKCRPQGKVETICAHSVPEPERNKDLPLFDTLELCTRLIGLFC